jgi:hypothetical protein
VPGKTCYLNACYTDLDGYRLGKSADQLMEEVLQVVNAECIPCPNILAKSGRGVWLFWLLHDAKGGDLPQRAFNDRIDEYCTLQRAIAERFSRFMADAKDASRVARVPGSLNSKSDVVVHYRLLGDERRHPVTYTLRELANRFGVKPKQYHAKVKAAFDERESTERYRGWKSLQAKRVRQFETLRSMRGGFSEGCRNHAAVLYTHFLTQNGIRGVDLERHLEEFAAECRPALSNSELRGAIQTGRKMKTGSWSISNQTIAQWLDITPDEADQLEGWSPAPRFCDTAARRQFSETTTRAERAAARHAAIVEIVGRLRSQVPSLRKMTDLLKEFGHDVSHITVRNDYRSLRLNPPASAGSRSDGLFFDTSLVA